MRNATALEARSESNVEHALGISFSLRWRHMGGVKLAALDHQFNLTNDVSPGHTRLRAPDYLDIATVFRFKSALSFGSGLTMSLIDSRHSS